MKHEYSFILGIFVIIGVILISGCVQHRTGPAQTAPPFGGYLFSLSNGDKYFVLTFEAPRGYHARDIITENEIKNLTGLDTVKPPLGLPIMTKEQAITLAQNKLSEIITTYEESMATFNQETCTSECEAGEYCEPSQPPIGSTDQPPVGEVPCNTDPAYCQQYCQQKETALRRGYDVYSNATPGEASLLFDHYGSPKIYEIFAMTDEGFGAIFAVNMTGGINLVERPSDLAGIDTIGTNRYSGLFWFKSIDEWIDQKEAENIFQRYMDQQGISSDISDVLYIMYWPQGAGVTVPSTR